VDDLPDGKGRANPTQESTPKGQVTGGYAVETVVSQRPRVRQYSDTKARGKDSTRVRYNTTAYPPHTIQTTNNGQHFFHEPLLSGGSQRRGISTHRLVRPETKPDGEVNDKTQGPRGPPLTGATPRFWTVGDGPMFFPASLEGFHLGSYDAPLLRDVRRLAPFPAWSSSLPLGGLGDDTRKNLWLPQDLICIQHVGLDNTYDMTSRTPPTRHPIVLPQQQHTQADNTYKEALCRPVPLLTNPPTVIQIQIDETGNRDRRPHPKPNLGKLREHSGLDDQSDDEKHLERREEIMTENTGPGDPQNKRGRARSPHSDDEEDLRHAALRSWNPKRTDRARHVGPPHHSGGEDLRNVINRLGAGKRHERGETRSQDPGQSTRENCESHYRGTDPNEHRT
jgi:hypothetical protein